MPPTLLTPPRIVFACLLTVAASWFAFIVTEREGDSQAAIANVDRQINEIGNILKRYTYELKEPDSPKPAEKSRALYRLSGPKGELLFVEGPADPDTSEIERIVGELYKTGTKQYVALDSAWSEVQAGWANLTWHNKQIAETKALREFPSKPSGASSYDWDNRFRKINGPWQVQEPMAFQIQRITYILGAAISTFVAVILFLAACGWLWRATLARIREFSNAVRGK